MTIETEPGITGFLVIDTETSGLFDFKRPADAEGQPRLCELCMIRVTPDLKLDGIEGAVTLQEIINRVIDHKEKNSAVYHAYIKPDGWGMSGDAEEANGITDELLEEHGIPVREVLEEYSRAIQEGRTVVAFGAQYDTKVMRGELRRAGMPDLFEETPNICCMRKSAPLCDIKWPNGRAGYKWPKLTEALKYYAIDYTGPLGACRDAMAAFNIFKELVARGYAGEARVHYAKNRPTPLERS